MSHEKIEVSQIDYDKGVHTVYIRMGNGTESTYADDHQRKLL